jgi:hypothetical protein
VDAHLVESNGLIEKDKDDWAAARSKLNVEPIDLSRRRADEREADDMLTWFTRLDVKRRVLRACIGLMVVRGEPMMMLRMVVIFVFMDMPRHSAVQDCGQCEPEEACNNATHGLSLFNSLRKRQIDVTISPE